MTAKTKEKCSLKKKSKIKGVGGKPTNVKTIIKKRRIIMPMVGKKKYSYS